MADTYINWDINGKVDTLRENIGWRISAWYDNFYMGSPETKLKHLELFERRYDKSLFSKDTIEEDIRKFLTDLQEEFDNRLR